MYEIWQGSKEWEEHGEKVKVKTFSREVVSCNLLEVEAGTTGYRGGDAGHGGRAYFRVQDSGFGGVEAHSLTDGGAGFVVLLRGDSEIETMIRALKFIVKVLEKETRKERD